MDACWQKVTQRAVYETEGSPVLQPLTDFSKNTPASEAEQPELGSTTY